MLQSRILLVAIISFVISIPTYALNGSWKRDSVGWINLNGKTYYLDNSGAMDTGEKEIDGKGCLFNTSGEFYDYNPSTKRMLSFSAVIDWISKNANTTRDNYPAYQEVSATDDTTNIYQIFFDETYSSITIESSILNSSMSIGSSISIVESSDTSYTTINFIRSDNLTWGGYGYVLNRILSPTYSLVFSYYNGPTDLYQDSSQMCVLMDCDCVSF